ncbi:hypothetical protein M977_04307 [Buttiauxella gaviniae ATCC 51604]|uniref:Uncharacterized protein n=1 Tax=Buttiauxella gaviniae ATCC 51604 TaxID=1354253 RepID=A0A1B7HNC9_9ENTR|nr:hypothetical protein M977_04307 [Buttiauxella gaviniae ATCC 51604]
MRNILSGYNAAYFYVFMVRETPAENTIICKEISNMDVTTFEKL